MTYVLVGTAVNRFYFKKTGTDQIPLKGCFQSVWKSIKVREETFYLLGGREERYSSRCY